MALRPEQAEALAIIGRWYSARKCHRIDQLMHDHPEYATEAARYYEDADHNISSGSMVMNLINRDVPGVAEAIIEANGRYKAIAPEELLNRRAKELAAGGRAA